MVWTRERAGASTVKALAPDLIRSDPRRTNHPDLRYHTVPARLAL